MPPIIEDRLQPLDVDSLNSTNIIDGNAGPSAADKDKDRLATLGGTTVGTPPMFGAKQHHHHHHHHRQQQGSPDSSSSSGKSSASEETKKRATEAIAEATKANEHAAKANREALEAGLDLTAEHATAILEKATAAGAEFPFQAGVRGARREIVVDEATRPENMTNLDTWQWIAVAALVALASVAALVRLPLLGYFFSSSPVVPDAATMIPPYSAVTEFNACLSRLSPVVGQAEAELQCHAQLAALARERPAAMIDSGDSAASGLAGDGGALPLVSPLHPASTSARTAAMLTTPTPPQITGKIFAAVLAGLFSVLLANFSSPSSVHHMLATSGVLWFISSVSCTLSLILWPQMSDSLLYLWIFSTAFWLALAVFAKSVYQFKLPTAVATGLSVGACTFVALIVRMALLF